MFVIFTKPFTAANCVSSNSPVGFIVPWYRRYERKKNIGLAISALQHFKTLQRSLKGGLADKRGLLVVAGGYDLRVDENVEYLEVSMDTPVA